MESLYSPKTGKGKSKIDFCGYCPLYCFFKACVFIVFLFLVPLNVIIAQEPLLEKTISIPKQHTTLYKALDLISQNADCFFIYDSETLESDKRVRLYADHQPLNKVLDNILSNPELAYKVVGKHILIYKPKNDTPPIENIQPFSPSLDIINNVIIKGHIYDNESKTAIPYATIGIVEENIGTVTNSDGFFLLKIPDSLIGTSLVVSHLGYMSQRIPVRLISEQQVDLYLVRRIISIQEVIIRYLDPNLIIEKAMAQRKANYAPDPVYLTAFYREGVRKNEKYTSYSEAVFKVYKSPYNAGAFSSDQVKLLKSRKARDTDAPDTVFLKLKAGVQSALQLDIVKFVAGFLDLSPPVEYTYSYSNMVSYNARDAYAISFTQVPGLEKALYTGTVYIEKESFAILGADFEINPEYLDLAAADLLVKTSHKLIARVKKVSYSVSYMPYNSRYYLSHVRCDIQVTTRLRHHLSSDHFSTFLEFATCKIDTAGVEKFPKQETLKPTVVFSDQPYNSDDAFWGSFNIITPEAKLTEALSGMIGKIEEIR